MSFTLLGGILIELVTRKYCLMFCLMKFTSIVAVTLYAGTLALCLMGTRIRCSRTLGIGYPLTQFKSKSNSKC